MIKGINHVGISVSSIDRSFRFYRDVMGMEVVVEPRTFSGELYEKILALEGAVGKVALLKKDSLQLELFEFSHPAPRPKDANHPVSDHGISHFCIDLVDLDSEYERLKAAGVRFHCP